MVFPVSQVDIFPLWPPLVALGVSFFTSMGGVSGAFLLLPFQVSVLGFTSPAVSSTNLVFNIIAIPSGVYRFIREGRMAWPLTLVTALGTLPGVFVGFFVRVRYLPDPRVFKFFVGLVLLYIGLRVVLDILGRKKKGPSGNREKEFHQRLNQALAQNSTEAKVRTLSWSFRRVTYLFYGETFSFSVPGLFLLALAVGVIGGAYGIGGGAIIAPFIVTFFRLPVYTVAGAALMGTFLTSIVGVIFYSLVGPYYASMGTAVSPDWLLGALFGLGGLVGMYLGARCQKYVPEKLIKSFLAGVLLFVSLRYIFQFIS